MPTRKDFVIRMDWEMTNWAAVYCGKLNTELRRGDDTRPTPDEGRASLVESALLQLKNGATRHRRYYKVLMVKYRNRWPVYEAMRYLRVPERTYRGQVHAALKWLAVRLDAQN